MLLLAQTILRVNLATDRQARAVQGTLIQTDYQSAQLPRLMFKAFPEA
jgi:hypothetical protein